MIGYCSGPFSTLVEITTYVLLPQRHLKRPPTIPPASPTCQQARHGPEKEALGLAPRSPLRIFNSVEAAHLFGGFSRHRDLRMLQSPRQRSFPRTFAFTLATISNAIYANHEISCASRSFLTLQALYNSGNCNNPTTKRRLWIRTNSSAYQTK